MSKIKELNKNKIWINLGNQKGRKFPTKISKGLDLCKNLNISINSICRGHFQKSWTSYAL